MPMTVGEKIKALRESLELSQEELGSRIGVKRAAVNKYEKGTVENIPIKTIEKLANIFDVTPQFLLGWDDIEAQYSYETRILKGVKRLYSQQAVELLYLFDQLNHTGQKKIIHYADDLQKVHAKDNKNV